MDYISISEQNTIDLGFRLAKLLNVGDIVVLSGNLGAGKTKFTSGVLKYFGLDSETSSPTFTIVNEHNINQTKLFHFDVYRLEDSEEFLAIGGDEYFSQGICIIEWGEKIKDVLPKSYLNINFEPIENDFEKRKIQINVIGNEQKYLEIMEALKN